HEHEHEHEQDHETEYHESHVHGTSELLLAIEGHQMEIHFQSPAVNLLGFEHKPQSPTQQQRFSSAVKTLAQADSLFGLPAGAECELEKADVQAPFEDVHDDHGHEKQAEQEHADFSAHYHYHCKHTSKLTGLNVNMFEHFPLIELIRVQALSDKGQQSFELHSDHRQIEM
ncbi:MAG: DUF2796 domain-containing protein, partial [Gammaproteobacteria bacterium]|nr:DUF2796 domain-containing protein [Gammaproteobacteria bacterium]